MKFFWEEEDIKPGRFIICASVKEDASNYPKNRYAATVVYQIGWQSTKEGNTYGKTSVATDGMWCPIGTKQEVADKLNADPRGYRPLSRQEFNRIFKHTDQGFFPGYGGK